VVEGQPANHEAKDHETENPAGSNNCSKD
jgi:hypothetical protein